MKKITYILASLALVLPAVSSAATYLFVDVSGSLRTTEAVSSQQALMALPGLNAHPKSGVMLYTGAPIGGQSNDMDGTASGYSYIDVNGNYKVVVASSPAAAMALATDIHPQSGVMALD